MAGPNTSKDDTLATTLQYDELVNVLAKTTSWGEDISPREALYIKFGANERSVKDTITYHTVDGGLLAVDIDAEGKVLGIKLL